MLNSPPDPAFAALGYSLLSPERVLDLLDAVGFRGDGRILQLNSFENRVFQVYLEAGGAVVAKFYRPGRWSEEQILEEHTFAQELATAEVPVVPPLALQATGIIDLDLLGQPPTLAHHRGEDGDFRYAVAPLRAGRAPELGDPQTLQWIGRFLGRLHLVGAKRAFLHRPAIGLDTLGDAARAAILTSGHLPDDVAAAWTIACDNVLMEVRRHFEKTPYQTLRLHGDCHRGNLLWGEHGPHFVDLDDAASGPAIQDLWMLLDGDRPTMRQQLAELVAGYEDFREFDWREVALIEPLRTLRMLHHSAWIAKRWHDPAFPAAFPWFGSHSYWSQQIADLRDQLDAMREADA